LEPNKAVNSPSTVMIMAAGMGKRMLPLTLDCPKPLIEVGRVKLLDHVLDHIRAAGIGQIVVNVHYLADQIEAHLARCALDFDVEISDERDVLRDTGGGLIKALPLISDDSFLTINADNWWTDGPANALLRLARHWDEARMDALMLLVPFDRANNTQGQGDFEMDESGRLSRRRAGTTAPYVWTGIQMISKRIIVDPPSAVFSTNVFWDRAIASDRLFGLEHDGSWFDVGYPEAIEATEIELSRG
jgi:N-acetyl-alpha-D-muramate 1-phosphate uridylyltransferase